MFNKFVRDIMLIYELRANAANQYRLKIGSAQVLILNGDEPVNL
jgi:hypothetical protein